MKFSLDETQSNEIPSGVVNLYNFPSKEYGDFFLRKRELDTLLQYLSPSYRQHLIIVNGADGVGKTALVIEAAFTLKKEFKHYLFKNILFVSLDEEATLLYLLKSIFKSLNESSLEPTPELSPQSVYIMLEQRKVLLIVDGAEDVSPIQFQGILDFLSDLPKPTKAIITTRDKTFLHNHITLEPLPMSERIQLIKKQCQSKQFKLSSVDIERIAKDSKGLPGLIMFALSKYCPQQSFACQI